MACVVQPTQGRVHRLDAHVVDAGIANAPEHLVAIGVLFGEDGEHRKVERLPQLLTHDHDFGM